MLLFVVVSSAVVRDCVYFYLMLVCWLRCWFAVFYVGCSLLFFSCSWLCLFLLDTICLSDRAIFLCLVLMRSFLPRCRLAGLDAGLLASMPACWPRCRLAGLDAGLLALMPACWFLCRLFSVVLFLFVVVFIPT